MTSFQKVQRGKGGPKSNSMMEKPDEFCFKEGDPGQHEELQITLIVCTFDRT